MEDYAAKMQLKSDATLREYVTGYAQYRDEAVLAALAELRRRGQPADEEMHLRPLLEAAVQQQRAAAALAAPVAPASTPADEAELPQLYSPAGIAVLSTVFVPAGALLLAINMVRLRRGRAVWGLAAFTLLYIVGEAWVIYWLFQHGRLNYLTPLLLDLPLIVAYVWWFWPRYVGTNRFQPRNWLLPFGICLLIKYGLLPQLLALNPQMAKQVKVFTEQIQQQMQQ